VVVAVGFVEVRKDIPSRLVCISPTVQDQSSSQESSPRSVQGKEMILLMLLLHWGECIGPQSANDTPPAMPAHEDDLLLLVLS
jgi:hypothetical protein